MKTTTLTIGGIESIVQEQGSLFRLIPTPAQRAADEAMIADLGFGPAAVAAESEPWVELDVIKAQIIRRILQAMK